MKKLIKKFYSYFFLPFNWQNIIYLFFITSLLYIVYVLINHYHEFNPCIVTSLIKLYSKILAFISSLGFDQNIFLNKMTSIGYLNIALSGFTLFFNKTSYGILTEHMIEIKYGNKPKIFIIIGLISYLLLIYSQSSKMLFLALCQLGILFFGIILYISILIDYFSNIKKLEQQLIQYFSVKLIKLVSSHDKKHYLTSINTVSHNLSQYIKTGKTKEWTTLVTIVCNSIKSNINFDNSLLLYNVLQNAFGSIEEKINFNVGFIKKELPLLFCDLIHKLDDDNEQISTETKEDIYIGLILYLLLNLHFTTVKSIFYNLENYLPKNELLYIYTLYTYGFQCLYICKKHNIQSDDEEDMLEYQLKQVSLWLSKDLSNYLSKNNKCTNTKTFINLREKILLEFSVTINSYAMLEKSQLNKLFQKNEYNEDEFIENINSFYCNIT